MADDNDKSPLTRRRVLGGMATIGAAGAVGAGSWAAFSDEESSTGNTATAGTLNLKVNGENLSGQSVTLRNGNLAPGDSGSYSGITLQNTGSVSGKLSADLNITSAQENSRDEAEKADDPNGGGNGELDNVLKLKVTNVKDSRGYHSLRFYDRNTPFTLVDSLSSSADITIEWKVPEDADNSIQSDSVTFDVTFSLEQQISQS